jgi:radical SAM protein with 4Fe4S-binding SPASM domain
MYHQNSTLRAIYATNNIEVVNSYPQTIQILPLMRCNYRCKMCFINEEQLKSGEEISFDALRKLDPILPFVESVYLTGGEPLLYSGFDELTSMASGHGCSIKISTNGSLIEHRFDSIVNNVHELKVSIDAATSQTYKSIRIGGRFEKVINGLVEIAKWKARNRSIYPILKFSFVSMYSNVHELPALIKIAANIGVVSVYAQYMGNKKGKKELIKESLFYHKEYSDEWFLKAMDTAKSLGVEFTCRGLFNQKKENECTAKFSKTKICTEPWRYMVVNANGNVTPCCPSPMVMGNLNDQTFDEIWNNEQYAYLRRKINTGDEPPECANCTNCKIDLSREKTFVGEAAGHDNAAKVH